MLEKLQISKANPKAVNNIHWTGYVTNNLKAPEFEEGSQPLVNKAGLELF